MTISSSSVLLATLAISCSSSSLAAPASDAPQAQAGMSTSYSNRRLSQLHHSGSAARGLRAADVDLEDKVNGHKRTTTENKVEEREPSGAICETLGGVLNLDLCGFATKTMSSLRETSQNIKLGPEDMSALQNGGPKNASASTAPAPSGAPAPSAGPLGADGAVAETSGNTTAPTGSAVGDNMGGVPVVRGIVKGVADNINGCAYIYPLRRS